MPANLSGQGGEAGMPDWLTALLHGQGPGAGGPMGPGAYPPELQAMQNAPTPQSPAIPTPPAPMQPAPGGAPQSPPVGSMPRPPQQGGIRSPMYSGADFGDNGGYFPGAGASGIMSAALRSPGGTMTAPPVPNTPRPLGQGADPYSSIRNPNGGRPSLAPPGMAPNGQMPTGANGPQAWGNARAPNLGYYRRPFDPRVRGPLGG